MTTPPEVNAGQSGLSVGSLFSGIGGIDLGLERAGMRVAWQCEIDPYCRRVLAKHWPDVPCYEDVRNLPDDIEPVDLICGGYPCQPFSLAGGRKGKDDPRHLWPAFAGTLRLLRPRWALLENVPGHLSLGFGDVLSDLAALGYDTEWTCIPAAAVGAPHLRWRLFVVAHANGEGESGQPLNAFAGPRIMVSDTGRVELGLQPVTITRGGGTTVARDDGSERSVADAGSGESDDGHGADVLRRRQGEAEQAGLGGSGSRTALADAPVLGLEAGGAAVEQGALGPAVRGWWTTEPDVGRVAHGVPSRVDRLRALGNAVVPQVAELVGRRIVAAHFTSKALRED